MHAANACERLRLLVELINSRESVSSDVKMSLKEFQMFKLDIQIVQGQLKKVVNPRLGLRGRSVAIRAFSGRNFALIATRFFTHRNLAEKSQPQLFKPFTQMKQFRTLLARAIQKLRGDKTPSTNGVDALLYFLGCL